MKNIVIIGVLVFVLFSCKNEAKKDSSLANNNVEPKENIFLDRDFWKTKPTVEVVEQKINEGNNPSELNTNGFDAVTYAILSEVPNKTIKHLLSKEGNGVNKLTHDKRTYVFWAAYKGNLELVQHLINNKARLDLKDSHNNSPLTFAIGAEQTNTEIYDLFIENGIDIKNDVNERGANALLLSISNAKDFELAKYFISKGLDLHSVDNDGNGVFNYASKTGNEDLLNLLIKKGVAYKPLNKQGGNAFMFAVEGTRDHENTVKTYKYLEKLGLQPNITTNDGFTPLHALGYNSEDADVFNYFIEKGVDVNQQDVDGNTAFMNAIYENSLNTITLLSKHVTDINTPNKKGISPLMRAVGNNTTDVVSFLLDKGANTSAKDKKGNSLVSFLLKSYDEEDEEEFENKIQLLKDKTLNFSELQANGENLWHIAVKRNNIDLLKKLVQFKAPINLKSTEGYTPLHLASMKATDAEILKFLIAQGADKSIKTDFEETALDLAKENELLQKNAIDINFLKL